MLPWLTLLERLEDCPVYLNYWEGFHLIWVKMRDRFDVL